MNIYALANRKGGAGKSTLSVGLAESLAEEGHDVLLIDADEQGDTSRWLDVYGTTDGLYSSLKDDRPLSEAVQETDVDGLDVIPATEHLIKVTGEIQDRRALKKSVDSLPEKWDVVLIDCPPSIDGMTLQALATADGLIVPVQTRSMGMNGLARLLKTVNTVQEKVNPDLEITGIVANELDRRARHSGDVLDSLRERFNGQLFRTPIRTNIKLSEAPSFKETPSRYAPKSRGAEDFRKLANEFIQRENL